MRIKAIILRKVPEDMSELEPLLIELRSMCQQQKGYIRGETLLNSEDASECLVLSSWESMEAWNTWLASEKRAELQGRIDELLGEPTRYQVYYCA